MINMKPTAPRCMDPYMAPVPAQMARNSTNVVARAGGNAMSTGAGSTVNRAGLTAGTNGGMTGANDTMNGSMNGMMSPTGPNGTRNWNGSGNGNNNGNGGVKNLTGSNGNGNGMNMNTNMPMNRDWTGMESEIAPYNGNTNGDTTPNDGGEYGSDYDWTPEEEDGMTSIPQDSFNEPLTADEAARNSWRALLARNVGRNVLVSFLVGTQNTVVAEGELYEVGTDYLVIYQPLWDSHISADLYAVKFVEFREPPGQQLN